MEVLYGTMSNGSRRLTVREFLHCYCPDEIDKSRGIYSFAPKSPLLKVIFETPDSNRDWKSRYFFLDGDEWMCHPGDAEHMPVDTTWGILHPSGMHPSYRVTTLFNRSTYYVFFFFFNTFNRTLFLQFDGSHKLILRSSAFSRKFLLRPSQRKELRPN